MGQEQMALKVGRIIRASSTRFAVGCQVLRPQVPAFGSLVKVPAIDVDQIYGLIHDVRMEDDPFVRQMAVIDEAPVEARQDQRLNRQVPIDVSVLVVGYQRGEEIHHRLPPQPPLSLDEIHACTTEELAAFTERFDYFRLVLDNGDLPVDELLAANLRYAAAARGDDEDFLVSAGRELARLLAMDLYRLDAILRRIRP
ncbi:MAG: hypothetical protein PVI80_23205 [Anaerolineae bacterium]|jgi:hypothetical protein